MLYELIQFDKNAIPRDENGEIEEDKRRAVVEALASVAYRVLLFGVQFSFEDYRNCDELERMAITASQQRMRVEDAIRIGRAARSKDSLGDARVFAELDGGELHDEALVAKIMTDYIAGRSHGS